MLKADDVAERVVVFLNNHPPGWIGQNDLRTFLETSCSLKDICSAIPILTDSDLIDKMLTFLESVVMFEEIASELTSPDFSVFLEAAVGSPSERLRTIVVRAFDGVKKRAFPLEADLQLLMSLLTDDDTGLSQKVFNLLIKWVSMSIESEEEREVFVSRIVELYLGLKSGLNETNEFRFLTLFIEISKKGPNLFCLIQKRGCFDPIISQFLSSNSDLLVKLGSLTLIESLASFESGQNYLAGSNVLGSLDAELSGPLADSTTQISVIFSIASIIPFTHNVEQVKSILSPAASRFASVLPEFIVSVNNAERMCCMKALAQISTVADSNECVGVFMRQQWRSLSQISYALSDVDVEVVNSALDSLHTMLKRWESNPFMESVTTQHQLLVEIFNTFKRHPFPECRSLVYSVLGAVVLAEKLADSVEQKLLAEPSPIRYALLDYQSESDYLSRSAKCDFVRVLVKNEDKRILHRFFKKDEIENFIDFAEQGLQWVPVTTGKDELATEAA